MYKYLLQVPGGAIENAEGMSLSAINCDLINVPKPLLKPPPRLREREIESNLIHQAQRENDSAPIHDSIAEKKRLFFVFGS